MTVPQSPDTTRPVEDLVKAAGQLGPKLVRLSTTFVTLPLAILPEQPRNDAIKATDEVFTAVGSLHLSFLKAVLGGLDGVARGLNRVVNETATTLK